MANHVRSTILDVEQLDSENSRLKSEVQQLKQLNQSLQSKGKVQDKESAEKETARCHAASSGGNSKHD